VDLNLRLRQEPQALAELESYITYLEGNRQSARIIAFLEEMLKEHEDQILLQRALAEQLHRQGRTEEAISKLDRLGESLLTSGNKKEAGDVIRQILLMNPPNLEEYRQLLSQIQPGTV